MEEYAIEVEHISKSFRIFFDKSHNLKEQVIFSKRRKYEDRQVLNDISFKVKKGEAIGLIGHNGCGKSTTLKLLSKIMYPDTGTIKMKGRVSSLIELGAGFHPDMSGRENIYTNASIFGLNKKEIDERLDDIIAFSELEEFIDNPVRTYSSGMYMRLAFAVAINVDADILLIDEILAVGDMAFQAKCFNRLREIKSQGTTIVIVSHNLAQIEQICERSIWIHEGRIKAEGVPRDVDPMYMEYMSLKEAEQTKKLVKVEEENEDSKKQEETLVEEENNSKRWGSREAYMKDVFVFDKNDKQKNIFTNDESIKIRIGYKATKELNDVVFGIAIYRSDNLHIYGTNTLIDYAHPSTLKGEGYIDLDIKCLSLNSGEYSIDLAFHKPDGFNYDFWKDACKIIIQNKLNEAGIISIVHNWEIK